MSRLSRRAWQRLSAGNGSKRPRFYAWTWVGIDAPNAAHNDAAANHPLKPGQRWLLIRRNNSTGELAYRCYAPKPVPLRELVRVAGRRWTVEESFQASKTLTGLDQHQVRRWILLAALDRAGDARLRLPRPRHRDRTSRKPNPTRCFTDRAHLQRDPQPVQHPHRRTIRDLRHRLRWSRWRRRHQHRARAARAGQPVHDARVFTAADRPFQHDDHELRLSY
ncbi:MAG: hypothetical protein ACRDP9_03525 [Kribbellaceae bacterium]